ncbi:MAG: matrixin family metalloprotease [Candidatus Obscuribacter sp.]|nr:matrixin family metalloprotease [Candidatus Obscuribacter sp.]
MFDIGFRALVARITAIALGLSFLAVFGSAVFAANNAQLGFQYYQAKQFSKAIPLLKKANAQNPRDLAILFYLGSAAAFSGDTALAIDAFSRLYVVSGGIDKYTCAVDPLYARLRSVNHPYSCRSGSSLIRWHPKCVPVRIFITDGKEIPAEFAGKTISSDALLKLSPYFHSPAYLNSLAFAQGYNPAQKSAVLAGLSQWSFLNKEKYLSYTVVNDPSHADVIVFWTNRMVARSGYTSYPPSQGVSYPLASVRGCPVVVQFNSLDSPTTMARAACHEFGHCFGLQHSPNKSDIMYETLNGAQNPSYNISDCDQLTIRALYRVPADIYLMSN